MPIRIYDHTGEKIGTWTIIEIVKGAPSKTYKFRCDCGNEELVTSGKVYVKSSCRKCKPKLRNNALIGERHGKLICLGYHYTGKRHGLRIQCDCGNIFISQCYSQFVRATSCNECKLGSYPGKRIAHSMLIKRVRGAIWEKKCDCGTIFVGYPRKTNCGCLHKAKTMEKARSKIGEKYQFLTVKNIVSNENGHIQLLIGCKCGNEFIRNNGHEFKSQSCGCKLPVPVGEKAANATLKNFEVHSMRELYKSGLYSIEQLSKMFNKSKNYIQRIVQRHIWKHI